MTDYSAIDAVNWSTLRAMLRSPLHFQHSLANEREETAALAFGWAFALWGTFLYWWSGLRYVQQAVSLGRPVSP